MGDDTKITPLLRFLVKVKPNTPTIKFGHNHDAEGFFSSNPSWSLLFFGGFNLALRRDALPVGLFAPSMQPARKYEKQMARNDRQE